MRNRTAESKSGRKAPVQERSSFTLCQRQRRHTCLRCVLKLRQRQSSSVIRKGVVTHAARTLHVAILAHAASSKKSVQWPSWPYSPVGSYCSLLVVGLHCFL